MYPPLISLIVTQNYIGEEGARKPGERIRVIEARARHLIEHGHARLDKPAGPTETQIAAPAENKAAAAPELAAKKPSGAPTTGPLIGTPSSVAPGPAAPSLSLPAVQASVLTRPTNADVPGIRRRTRGASRASAQ